MPNSCAMNQIPAPMPGHGPRDSSDASDPRATSGGAEGRAREELESLLQRMRSTGDGNDRLQRMRHAIASGEFHGDARAIAERLIARLLTS